MSTMRPRCLDVDNSYCQQPIVLHLILYKLTDLFDFYLDSKLFLLLLLLSMKYEIRVIDGPCTVRIK